MATSARFYKANFRYLDSTIERTLPANSRDDFIIRYSGSNYRIDENNIISLNYHRVEIEFDLSDITFIVNSLGLYIREGRAHEFLSVQFAKDIRDIINARNEYHKENDY